jgi:hypothetical protein
LRAVFDTNVLISALLVQDRPAALLMDYWLDGRFALLTCPEQIEEFARVLKYPRLRKRISRAAAGRMVNDLRVLAESIARPPKISASTDPNDDYLLALAAGGKADYLVTGDKSGLLALGRFRRTRIITARALADVLDSRSKVVRSGSTRR